MTPPGIEVRPQRGRHPLWRGTGAGSRQENVDPAALPLRAETVRDLSVWAAGREAIGGEPDDEDAFWAAGLLLASRVAIELAGQETVAYFDGRLSCLVPLLPADGGVRVDEHLLPLPGHWIDLASSTAELRRLSEQLSRELPAGHVLHGREANMIARCGICDDVLLRIPDDGYAVVHLTWRQAPEISADWPATSMHSDQAALLADLADRHL